MNPAVENKSRHQQLRSQQSPLPSGATSASRSSIRTEARKRNRPLLVLLAMGGFLNAFGTQASAQSGSLPNLPTLTLSLSDDAFHNTLFAPSSDPALVTGQDAIDAFNLGGKWVLELGTGAAYDSNALDSVVEHDDFYWQYAAKLAYQFWLDEKSGIVITPFVAAEGQRYYEYSEQDSNALVAGINTTFKNLPLSPTLGYSSTWGFDRDFGENPFTQHTPSLSLTKEFKFGEAAPAPAPVSGKSGKAVQPAAVEEAPVTTLTLRLTGGYGFADPSFLDNAFVNGSADLAVPVTDRLSVGAGVFGGYRSYEDFVPEDRNVWTVGLKAGVGYALTKTLVINAEASYTWNDDTFAPKDYNEFVGLVTLSWTPDIDGFLGLPMKGKSKSY